MIEKISSCGRVENYAVSCDSCTRQEEMETEFGFMDIVEQMKDTGWKNRKIKDEWQNWCPACAEI